MLETPSRDNWRFLARTSEFGEANNIPLMSVFL
jgi:hypothetical protein